MKTSKKVSDYLSDIRWVDSEGKAHKVPVREFKRPAGQHLEIVAPAESLMPVIDIHVFQKETWIYAWACSEDQMEASKYQDYSSFSAFAGNDYQLVETYSKDHGSIKEFYCIIT